jgi:phosphonate transport system substrate-binding protein
VRQVLSQEQVKLNLKQLFAGSSSNVYKTVLLGKSAAGAVLDVDFDSQPQDVKDQLKVMVRTPKMAPHPIAALPRVPKSVRDSVTKGVQSLWKVSANQELMKLVQLADPVAAEYKRDYKHLEALDYEALTKGF